VIEYKAGDIVMYRREGASDNLRGTIARLLNKRHDYELVREWTVEVLFTMNPNFHKMSKGWCDDPFFKEQNIEPFTQATPGAEAASEKVTP
jgi:hypothetical protein